VGSNARRTEVPNLPHRSAKTRWRRIRIIRFRHFRWTGIQLIRQMWHFRRAGIRPNGLLRRPRHSPASTGHRLRRLRWLWPATPTPMGKILAEYLRSEKDDGLSFENCFCRHFCSGFPGRFAVGQRERREGHCGEAARPQSPPLLSPPPPPHFLLLWSLHCHTLLHFHLVSLPPRLFLYFRVSALKGTSLTKIKFFSKSSIALPHVTYPAQRSRHIRR